MKILIVFFLFIFRLSFPQEITLDGQYNLMEFIDKDVVLDNDETIEFYDSTKTFYHQYTNHDCCSFKGRGRYYIQDSLIILDYEHFPIDDKTRNLIYVVNNNLYDDSTHLDITLILRENSSTSFGTSVNINDSIFYMDRFGKLRYSFFSFDDSVMIKFQLYGQEKKIPIIRIKNKYIYLIADYSNDCRFSVIEYEVRKFLIRKTEKRQIVEFCSIYEQNIKYKSNKYVDTYYLKHDKVLKRIKKLKFVIRI